MTLVNRTSERVIVTSEKTSIGARSQLANGEEFDITVITFPERKAQNTIVVHSASPYNKICKQLSETIPLEGRLERKYFKRTAEPYINIICDGATRQIQYTIAFWNAIQDDNEVTLGMAFRPGEPDNVFYFNSSAPKADQWSIHDKPTTAILALRESMLDLAADIMPDARALWRETTQLIDAPMLA